MAAAVEAEAFPPGHVLDLVARLGLLPTDLEGPTAVVVVGARHLLEADRGRSIHPQDQHRNCRAVNSSLLVQR